MSGASVLLFGGMPLHPATFDRRLTFLQSLIRSD